jgi:periplasmic divalent cation tolerance protein
MAEHLMLITTTDSREAADRLAAGVIDARLAACAQIDGPISSVYWWEGKATSEEEWRVLFKTSAERYEELEAHIKAHHDYDVPEIVATPLTRGSAEYLGWVTEETAGH